MPILVAVGVSAGVAVAARLLQALTRSGALAAIPVGSAILWATGWPGAFVLGTFFLSSTLVGRAAGSAAPGASVGEGAPRDHRQVLANGAPAAIGALAEPIEAGLGLWLVTVALAAAGSDTWATGMGALSPRPPRDILRGRVVPPGSDGGVTWFGSLGGLIGAALVGLAGAATSATRPGALYLAATGVGFAAMVLDSVLGSGLQGRKGWRWLDNNGVNAAAVVAALGAGLLAWLWSGSS
jgi:uncharacterized protein (TIGR00297 family)